MGMKLQLIQQTPDRPAQPVRDAEVALVHGTGGTLGVAHSGATLILSGT